MLLLEFFTFLKISFNNLYKPLKTPPRYGIFRQKGFRADKERHDFFRIKERGSYPKFKRTDQPFKKDNLRCPQRRHERCSKACCRNKESLLKVIGIMRHSFRHEHEHGCLSGIR